MPLVSNPGSGALNHFRKMNGRHDTERQIANNFVFLIEELRKQLEAEKERLAERVFCSMLEKDNLRFLIIGKNFDWSFPKTISVKPTAKTLTRKDGSQLELSLFEFVPEEEFNDTEKAVAWYLENQHSLFFWYRNRSRHDYSIQGWREHRIYPDFIFTATGKSQTPDYERVYVVETKGLHLKDNAKDELRPQGLRHLHTTGQGPELDRTRARDERQGAAVRGSRGR